MQISEIFFGICNLSYMGDIRFLLGAENPNKVKNIVDGNYKFLKEIYRNIFEELGLKIYEKDEIVEIPNEKIVKKFWFDNMPKLFIENTQNENMNEIIKKFEAKIKKINRKNSIKGILCGAFSTDIGKSLKYSLNKFKKGI